MKIKDLSKSGIKTEKRSIEEIDVILLLWEKYELKIIISTLYSIFIVSYIVFKYVENLKDLSKSGMKTERRSIGEIDVILLLWEKYEWKIIINTLYSIFIISYIVFKYIENQGFVKKWNKNREEIY